MPAGPRRITIHAPFNFERSRSSVTFYSATGEFFVPGDAADFAIANGYATEGWARGSTTRTSKGGTRRKKATGQRKSVKAKADAGTDTGSDAGMGGTAVAAAHRAVTGQQPAPSAD
jgi:hypothetical protein